MADDISNTSRLPAKALRKKRQPRYPEVSVSAEELALVLSGFKTLHYFNTNTSMQTNRTILLTCGRGEHKITVPIVVDSGKVVASFSVLNPEETKATGRYVTGEYTPFVGKRDTARNQERAARLAAEPKLPALYRALDIAGSDGNNHVTQRIRFHVKTATDLKPKDAKRVRGYLRNAYTKLAPLIKEAHNYEFPQLGKDALGNPVPLPNPPEDMGMVRALRFMTKQLDTTSLSDVLSHLSLPGTISSKRNPIKGRLPEIAGDKSLDGIGGLGRMLVAYPSVHSDLGTGVLAAMGAIKMIASPAPLQSRDEKTLEDIKRKVVQLREELKTLKAEGKKLTRINEIEKEIPALKVQATQLAERLKHDDGRLLITLRACEHRNGISGHSKYDFEYPVIIPKQEPLSLNASEVSDQLAQECGYPTAKALLKAKGNPEFLSFYRFEQTLPADLPEYEAKAGKRKIERLHDVHAAWKGSGDSSIKRAYEYWNALEEPERTRALLEITNRRHAKEVDPNAPDPLVKLNGNGAIPADVQKLWEMEARGGSNSAASCIADHQPEQVELSIAERLRLAQAANAANQEQQRTQTNGKGWSVTPKQPSAQRYGKTKSEQLLVEKQKTGRPDPEEVAARNRERRKWRREKIRFNRELSGEPDLPPPDFGELTLINPDKRPAPKAEPENGHRDHRFRNPVEHVPDEMSTALDTRGEEKPNGEKVWSEQVPVPQFPERKVKVKPAEEETTKFNGKHILVRGRWRQVAKPKATKAEAVIESQNQGEENQR